MIEMRAHSSLISLLRPAAGPPLPASETCADCRATSPGACGKSPVKEFCPMDRCYRPRPPAAGLAFSASRFRRVEGAVGCHVLIPAAVSGASVADCCLYIIALLLDESGAGSALSRGLDAIENGE